MISQKPKKILILTQYFPPEAGAAQTRLQSLAKNLILMGHSVEVVCPMPNYPEGKIKPEFENKFCEIESRENLTIYRFWLLAAGGKGFDRLVCYLSFMITSMAYLFKRQGAKPDFIYVNSGPLFLSFPGAFMAWYFKKPWILNVADLWPRSVQQLSGLGAKILLIPSLAIEKWAYKSADYVTAITDGVQEVLINDKKVQKEKLLFLPNGVDLDFFKNQTLQLEQSLRFKNNLNDKIIFVYPGNHGYAHALDHLLKGAKAIQEIPELEKVHFLLIGGGSEKPKLLELAQSLALKNVTFVDPIPFEHLAQELHFCDVGLVHVRNTALAKETRPAKMFPLMAAQKPILYIGSGEGASLLQQSGGGWSAPSENVDSFVRSVRTAISEQTNWLKMGLNNYEYVKAHFSVNQLIQNWFHEL
jgi:colanic acid biosynthesis glycosyl transferase WcaI